MVELSVYQKFIRSTHFSGINSEYLEQLYESFLEDPNSVSQQWKNIFESMPEGSDVSHDKVKKAFLEMPKRKPLKQAPRIDDEVRRYGHLYATVNPISRDHATDPQTVFSNANPSLVSAYCGSVGWEYSYIDAYEEREWLRQQIEDSQPDHISIEEMMRRYQIVFQAVELERFLGKKFVGQKRFSLEGNETAIIFMETLLEQFARDDVSDVVIGMAHRGRLNVLVNTLGLSVDELIEKFEGNHIQDDSSGDVKYHLGYSSDRMFNGHHIHISLGYNPSHLEAIAPVVHGNTRARQTAYELDGEERNKAVTVVIHGDAALIGQGVVMEGLNQSQTPAYETGGSVHLVINNQIGFTTVGRDGRSSQYSTDVAKIIQAPVFHVNADDVDAVVRVARIAAQYRKKFKKDVFVDLVGYRKHGHNEADEPSGTQPKMYSIIREKESVDGIYRTKIQAREVAEGSVQKIDNTIKEMIRTGQHMVDVLEHQTPRFIAWQNYQGTDWRSSYKHHISSKQFEDIKSVLLSVRDNFTLQKHVQMLYKQRSEMLDSKKNFNWGLSELMAYVCLMQEGFRVRLIGQDTCRGTFAHRHAVYHDHQNGQIYTPLQEGAVGYCGDSFQVYNSVLSEYAALGYEYGYAETSPKTLVIWEAQFGDFVNGAQIIIDQFISSGWRKWGRMCGLVMYLPHGYEGMGPEHTSARLERFLQLCAEKNMQVCVPSTPAQMFHLLIRQMKRNYRRPLIVLTPKSLLRHHDAVSDYKEHASGQFEVVIQEKRSVKKPVKRLIVCSGKIYYQLKEQITNHQLQDIHLVRLEQLYPFPYQELKEVFSLFPTAKIIWCQEEPFNQGAWLSIQFKLKQCSSSRMVYFSGRESSAAPAVGYFKDHQIQQETLVQQALGLITNPYEEDNHEYRD